MGIAYGVHVVLSDLKTVSGANFEGAAPSHHLRLNEKSINQTINQSIACTCQVQLRAALCVPRSHVKSIIISYKVRIVRDL